jgi:uncharacterized protein YggE
MKKLILIFVILPFLSHAQIGDKNFIDQNYMEVTGKAEMEVAPDLVYIKILVNEKDNKNKTALADREKLMVAKLKELGIDTNKELLIKDMASNFKAYWLTKDEIYLSKEYQLLVRDGKTASKVFIELEKLGISNVSIDRVESSKMQTYRRDVKVDAVKAAKEKAEALASAIGQTVGKAMYIQELEGMIPMTANTIMIRGASSLYGSTAAPEIEFEKIRLEYSVLCRFELK